MNEPSNYYDEDRVQRKRARVLSTASATATPRPFYFADGDLVLRIRPDAHTEPVSFRIHAATLASASWVFAGMLDLSAHLPKNVESEGGVPVVDLYQDSPKDWIAALTWLYYPERFATPVMDALAGGMRLAHKYVNHHQMHSFRKLKRFTDTTLMACENCAPWNFSAYGPEILGPWVTTLLLMLPVSPV